MFQKLNETQNQFKRQLRAAFSKNAQTSLILVLVIAVALIIYSISLNWGRIAQYKTMTMIGSNSAAAQMASMIASHGEWQLQSQLGGRVKYCKRTNFFVLLITFIVAIIITIVTWGEGAYIGYVILAAVGAVMAGIALVIEVTVIEPGLTRLWNKMQANLPLDAQVIESAIQSGLQSIVSDQDRIYDHFDMDVDGLWVNSSDAGNIPQRKDKITRFAFYYTKRLQSIGLGSTDYLRNFMSSLTELLYDNPFGKIGPPPTGCTAAEQAAGDIKCQVPDNFGIFDPICNGNNPKPYCDPCCQPEFDTDGTTPLRPDTCTPEMVAACGNGDYPVTSYAYQYDPARENFSNTFLSFREQIGIDDENESFHRNKANPNTPPPQTLAVAPTNVFTEEDATGYWTATQQAKDLISPAVPDLRTGVFPFFWNMSQLVPALTIDPVAAPPIVQTYKSDSVVIMTANDPPTCTAAVCPNNFLVPPDQCASSLGFDSGAGTIKTDGFYWKPGSDEYCSATYPYNDCVGRTGNCADGTFNGTLPTCGCEAAPAPDKVLWHDDSEDNLVYWLKQFSVWARDFLQSDLDSLNKEFINWWPRAAFWISPKCPAAAGCSNPTPTDPTTCKYCNNDVNDGVLLMWRGMLGGWVDLLDQWLNKTTFATDTSFCMPTLATATSTADTQLRFLPIELRSMPSQQTGSPIPTDRTGAPMPPIWGDLNDTIACLNYNSNNFTKLQNCQTKCLTTPTDYSGNSDACLNLPRNPVNLNPTNNANYQNAQRLQDCLSSPCQDSFGAVLPECTALPGVAVLPNCVAFAPGNAFYDAVKTERNNQFDLSNFCEPSGSPTTAFQDNLVVALIAATNQEQKLKDRRDELALLRTQGLAARNTFMSGYVNIDAFLKPCSAGLELGQGCGACANGGPAAQLICARINYGEPALANFAIYGWQSRAVSGRGPTGTDPDKGYWHLIRVEAFAPKRCYGQCGTDRLPWVRTYMSGGFFNRKRCYELTDTTGTVMARVTRYDEDRDSPGARFINGQLLWKFRFTNPGVLSNAVPVGLESDCLHPAVYDDGVSPSTKAELNGAFMINDVPAKSGVSPACWGTVNALLARGVQTTTCARYEYDGTINHMSLKFVECDPDKVQLATQCAFLGTCP